MITKDFVHVEIIEGYDGVCYIFHRLSKMPGMSEHSGVCLEHLMPGDKLGMQDQRSKDIAEDLYDYLNANKTPDHESLQHAIKIYDWFQDKDNYITQDWLYDKYLYDIRWQDMLNAQRALEQAVKELGWNEGANRKDLVRLGLIGGE